jgi:catechol-2,3-dioxygenase
MSLFTKIDTFIIRVTDIASSKKWYQEVLELSPSYESQGEHPIVIFSLSSGSSLTLYQWLKDEEHSTHPSTSYPIFFAENIEEVYKKLVERKVSVSTLQKDLGTTFFSFYDIDGNKLEVCHWN